jgi:hypothetical protein
LHREVSNDIPTRFVIHHLYGIFLIFRSKTLKIEDPVYWDHMLQQGSDFHINAITLNKKNPYRSLLLVGFSLEVTNLQISSSRFLFLSLSNGPLCCSDFQYDYPLYLLLSIIHFTRNSSTANMPVTTDAVVDEDVSGECYHEGLTYVFDDVDPTELNFLTHSENDQDRLDYIEDVFEGSSDRKTS